MFTVKILSKWAGIGLGSVLLFVAVAYGAMRMNDGPVEFYPWFTISIGGPFRSGELNGGTAKLGILAGARGDRDSDA